MLIIQYVQYVFPVLNLQSLQDDGRMDLDLIY